MKPINTYRLQVDMFRNNGFCYRGMKDWLYQRPNVKGVYFVGAKSLKEARKLLQKHIGFGAICIPRWQDNIPDGYHMPYKGIRKYRMPGDE